MNNKINDNKTIYVKIMIYVIYYKMLWKRIGYYHYTTFKLCINYSYNYLYNKIYYSYSNVNTQTNTQNNSNNNEVL